PNGEAAHGGLSRGGLGGGPAGPTRVPRTGRACAFGAPGYQRRHQICAPPHVFPQFASRGAVRLPRSTSNIREPRKTRAYFFQRFHLSAPQENAMSDDFKPAPGHDLGRVLAVLRASRGLSKTDLANASGVPSSNISQYELGNQIPELKTLRRLLAAMNYTLAAIEPTERFLAQLDGLDHTVVAGPGNSPSERIDAVAADAAKAVFQWTRSCLAFLSGTWAGMNPTAEPAPTEETEEPIAPLDLGADESPPPGKPPF